MTAGGGHAFPDSAASVVGLLSSQDLLRVGLRPTLREPNVSVGDEGVVVLYTEGPRESIELDLIDCSSQDAADILADIVSQEGDGAERGRLEGADDAYRRLCVQSPTGTYSRLAARRGNVIFCLSIPHSHRAAGQLVSLGELVLERLGATVDGRKEWSARTGELTVAGLLLDSPTAFEMVIGAGELARVGLHVESRDLGVESDWDLNQAIGVYDGRHGGDYVEIGLYNLAGSHPAALIGILTLEHGGRLERGRLAGAEEAYRALAVDGPRGRRSWLVARRRDLVFKLSIPHSGEDAEQLSALAALVLERVETN